ncbi:hypothetical protein Syun_006311 [Stephania yunnanensis]|uniref:RING-type domain-containing protein n=1 Tax=Stephania yunnanensis TaxID=152371 RepID=A0AAP0PYE9_9MAGN
MVDRFVEFWLNQFFRESTRMSSRASSRRSTRRRRTALEVDLNDTPEGSDAPAMAEVIGEPPVDNSLAAVAAAAVAATGAIDVEEIDDDVVISSPRSFAEARNKARRNNGVTVIEDDLQIRSGDSEEVVTSLSLSSNNARRRRTSNQAIIDSDSYINLEGSNSSKVIGTKRRIISDIEIDLMFGHLERCSKLCGIDLRRKVTKSVEPSPPPPPKEPVFTCPVCIGPLTEETSTKCGHIFCKKCIKTAIAAQSKCPTCRRKLTAKDTFRILLVVGRKEHQILGYLLSSKLHTVAEPTAARPKQTSFKLNMIGFCSSVNCWKFLCCCDSELPSERSSDVKKPFVRPPFLRSFKKIGNAGESRIYD